MADQEGVPAEGGQGAGEGKPPVETPAAPAEDKPWFHSFKSPEDRGYAETKGWKDPDALLGSYRSLEKMHGVPPDRLLKIPENLDDADAIKPILAKLGYEPPKEASEYGFSAIEGINAERAGALEQIAHKHGVPKRIAEAVFKDIVEIEKAEIAAVDAREEEEAALERGQFYAKHGTKAEGKIEAARRFVRALGMDEDTMERMEAQMGVSKFWEFFAAGGEMMGEANFVDSAKKPGNAMTPEAAKAERARLMTDGEFVRKYTGGDLAAREKMQRLNQIIADGAAA